MLPCAAFLLVINSSGRQKSREVKANFAVKKIDSWRAENIVCESYLRLGTNDSSVNQAF